MATRIKCPQCGKRTELKRDSKSATCASCGAVITQDSALNQAIADASAQWTPYPNPTAIHPGMKGRFFGRDYEVRGRVVAAMTEEGVSYSWQEFQLVAPDGDIAYLEYEEGKWKWMKPFLPRNPIGPGEAHRLKKGQFLDLEGNPVLITEDAPGRVLFSEGNLTFKVSSGDRFDYVDAGSGQKLYALQCDADELEFFRGQTMTEREVLAAFMLREELARLDRRVVGRRSQNFFAGVCVMCALFSFLLWMEAGPQTGKVIASGMYPINNIGPEGVRFGPFHLDPAQRIHALVVQGSMTQSSAWVQGILETSDGMELLESQGDFWDESGYDDGPWHEWVLSSHSYFLAREKTPYYLRLYAERDNPGGAYNNAGYEIRSGVRYPGYLGTFSLFTFLAAILFASIGNREQLKKMSESMESDD